MADILQKARETRLAVLELIYKHHTSHVGSNMSCIDFAVVLYDNLKHKDHVVWSAGWKSATWSVLEDKPFTPMLPTGSAGHGLPIAVGMALAKKRAKEKGTIYVIMSEGELNEGTTWESAAIASQHGLDNLVVLIDVNGLQAMGATKDILNLEPLGGKWKAFGWNAVNINGHNHEEVWQKIRRSPKKNPFVIICDTIKGKGVKEFEGDNKWHYQQIDKEMYEKAILQLTS